LQRNGCPKEGQCGFHTLENGIRTQCTDSFFISVAQQISFEQNPGGPQNRGGIYLQTKCPEHQVTMRGIRAQQQADAPAGP